MVFLFSPWQVVLRVLKCFNFILLVLIFIIINIYYFINFNFI